MGEWWKAIESAPRDGTRVRLGWIEDGRVEYAFPAIWHDGEWRMDENDQSHFVDATHWRPEPPTSP